MIPDTISFRLECVSKCITGQIMQEVYGCRRDGRRRGSARRACHSACDKGTVLFVITANAPINQLLILIHIIYEILYFLSLKRFFTLIVEIINEVKKDKGVL